MGEDDKTLESTRMGTLINGSVSAETSRKRPLENGTTGVSVKYKRRNVSAHRDFPKGCGRFAPRLDGISREDAMNSKAGLESDATVESDPVKLSGISIKSETPELLKTSAQDGSDLLKALTPETANPLETPEVLKTSVHDGLDLSKDLTSETAKPLETSNQVEVLESSRKPVEHMALTDMLSQTEKVLDSADVAEVREPMNDDEPGATVLLESSDQLQLFDTSKSLQPHDTSILGLQLPRDSFLSNTLGPSKVSDEPQPSVFSVESTDERMSKKFPPRRRISAIRDFPPGCGRNIPRISKEEFSKIIASSKTKGVGDDKPSGEHRLSEKSVRDDAKKIREKVKDGDALGIKLKGNVTREIEDEAHIEFQGYVSKETTDSEQIQVRTASEIRDDAKQIREKVQTLTSKLKGNVAKEIGDKARVKSEEDVTKEMTKQVQVRTTSEIKLKQEDAKETSIRHQSESSLFQSGPNSPSVSSKTEGNVRLPEGKPGKESIKHSKERTLKRKSFGKSEDESGFINQSHGEESIGLEPFKDRVIVQALMAAPNCPWMQGKRAFKSSPTVGSARNKPKKHELMVLENSRSVSRKAKDESGNSEGKSTKKKLPPKGKAAYQDRSQLVVRDEEVSPEHDEEEKNVLLDEKSQDLEVNLIPFGLHTSSGKQDDSKVTREKVRETLRWFQVICRKLLQGEEAKSKSQGNPVKRIDLQASGYLKKKNKWVNTGKILGPVPGVEVGDEFHYRVELAIIGLHRPFQSGIDYIKEGGKILATSIVSSGGYSDDMDSSDVLVYSGQGGKPVGGGDKQKQAEDQKLERGNLALKNSMDAGTVVRVIRGFKETKGSDSLDTRGKVIATYIYDGLYMVENYWQETSRYGTSVFMFQLRRIPDQPELALKEVKKSKNSKVREGRCVVDISHGKEKVPICAVNTIDDEKPQPFTYITKIMYPEWYKITPPKGCDCTDGCSDSEKCSCAAKNGGEIPFNYDGAIVEAKPLVFECGPLCKCPPSCHNRVSQHGIKFQLEIFKTESRGWGVRSLTSIPSGSFVCEYTGELLQDKEAEQRTGNDEYLFDIGHNYNDRSLWDGLSTLIPDLQKGSSCEVVEDVGFTIDAVQYGNVGRFINHSCSPNLYAQNVLYDHDDKRMPHIMFFAAENIPPLQELTYHYNYVIDQVRDSEGNIKKKSCYCGSAECTGRLY